jgi:diguanylate cyclase (GGDEF)-like protein/PAS domain S-box-containing protein
MTNDPPPDIHDYLRLLERAPETFRRAWDAIAIYDLDGRVMLGNAAARAMVGPDVAAALQGNHFTSHLTLEEATKTARDFAHCVTLGKTVDSHSVFVDGSGKPVPVRVRLVPARVRGQVVGVIVFARDVRPRLDREEQFMRSEQQFRSLFENHPDGLALHDLEGRFVRVNDACVRLTGYPVDELIGATGELLAPDVWQADNHDRVRAAIERGETVEFEHTIITKSGKPREIEGRFVPLHVDGSVRGYCGIVRDVTEKRRLERNSARQASRIAELYRIAAAAGVAADEKVATALEAGMAELDAEWAYVTRSDLAGASIVVSAGNEPPVIVPDALLQEGFTVEGKAYGDVVFVQSGDPAPITTSDRDYIRALAVLIGSAIQQGERERRLDMLAFGDALTGLPNRALVQDRLERTLLSARRHRRSFAAHYIDIDHFKAINDTYGHHAGDAVLAAVSSWLRSVLRDSDTIGRMGGDEFVVLQPEIDTKRQVEELAGKLCGIRDQTFRIGADDIKVTISVGCGVFPFDGENATDILKAADSALYEVKKRGRDGFAIGNASSPE